MLPPPEATNPKMPIAFARSPGSVKRLTMSDSETADATAPPSPCTPRETTSIPCEVERPQASDATVNTRDSDQEQAAMAVQVAEPAAEQQEASVGEQVRVHDPRQGGVREAEVVLDRGQRDADDR